MKKKYDLLVFIGRMQPFHVGHKAVVDRALELADNVLILVGGAGKARTPRNPWTFDERCEMIRSVYPDSTSLIIAPIVDMTYNDEGWVCQVQETVTTIAKNVLMYEGGRTWTPDGLADFNIGLIGCKKDHTSYYIDLFPQWGSEAVDFVNPINATDVRVQLFENRAKYHEMVDNILPRGVADWIFHTQAIVSPGSTLTGEYDYYKAYRERFAPRTIDLGNGDTFDYEIMHHTVDAIVIQSGHILLIKRRSTPGENMWALPGGFLNPKEKLFDGAIRELREETKLKVPDAVLRGSVVDEFDADDPHRSERGRVISKVYVFKLKPGRLPAVKAASDAKKAKWVPLSDVKECDMFDDHYFLIQRATGQTNRYQNTGDVL